MSKDDEVRAVVTELDGLLGDLRANVDALAALLVPPAVNGEEVPAV